MATARKLTDEERADLRARGYEPAQAWVRRRTADLWKDVMADAREIASADDRADEALFIEGAWRDTLRLVEEEEEAARLRRETAPDAP